MRAIKTTALGLILTIASASFAPAQSLRESTGPAEFPPSSFKGSQYVDSSGCVFVRAGVGDSTTWVPRVTRDRKIICGAKPTFATAQPNKVPVIKDPPAQTAPAPAATAPAAAAASVPAAPKPVAPAPAPKTTQAAPRKASPECPDVSAVSKQYIGNSGGYDVRCGPQQKHPGDFGVGPKVAPKSPVSPQSRVIRPAAPQIPKGYKPAFEDDRMNPYRNRRTAMGDAQMRLVWTDTVPRRLVEVEVGQDLNLTKAQIEYRKNNASKRAKAAKSPAVKSSSALAKYRYVNIGAFTDPKQAEATARKLQRSGLPVRYGKYKKGKMTLKMVLVGPFKTPAQLQNAMSKAQKAGYRNASYQK